MQGRVKSSIRVHFKLYVTEKKQLGKSIFARDSENSSSSYEIVLRHILGSGQ